MTLKYTFISAHFFLTFPTVRVFPPTALTLKFNSVIKTVVYDTIVSLSKKKEHNSLKSIVLPMRQNLIYIFNGHKTLTLTCLLKIFHKTHPDLLTKRLTESTIDMNSFAVTMFCKTTNPKQN